MKYLSLILIFISGISYNQNRNVDLAIQQGHSDDILWLEVSSNNQFLASTGSDNKLIVWDLKSGNELAVFRSPQAISRFKFREDNASLIVEYAGSLKQNLITIDNMEMGSTSDFQTTTFRDQKKSVIKQGSVVLIDAKIVLYNSAGLKVKSKTSDYFDQYFTSVVSSQKNQLIFASNADGLVYVFSDDLKLLHQWKGHNSDANILCLSSDERYLFSGSNDRSIIKWEISSGKIINRFSAKNFPLFGVSVLNDRVVFGDELGNIHQIELNHPRLQTKTERNVFYKVSKTTQLSDSTIIYSSEDNKLALNHPNHKNQNFKSSTYSPFTSFLHYSLTKILDLYQEPYAEFTTVDVSPSQRYMLSVSQTETFEPAYLRIYDLSGKGKPQKSRRLYREGIGYTPKAFFLNDSIAVSCYVQGEIDLWKINNSVNDISFGTMHTQTNFFTIVKLNESMVLGYNENQIIAYDVYNRKELKLEGYTIFSMHYLKDGKVLASINDKDFIIISTDGDGLVASDPFRGHTNQITAACYLEEKQMVITSSLDGSIKFWNEKSEKLCVSYIPMGLNGGIFVTPEKYYMTIGKDLEHFGFKQNTDYFYPEQFDAFYNRPDIVLKALKFQNENLIGAYEAAYMKRIKNLGFTGEMLKADFHLPKVELMNSLEIDKKTDKNNIELTVKCSDSKYLLDRINIWVNDVAVHGTKGISIRGKNLSEYETTLNIELAKGKNKVQISVLNQAGAESFKETIEIESTAGKSSSDLYIVTIGVSNYKDSRYNLTYASKDAIDMVSVFSLGNYFENIYSKSLIDTEVTLENLLDLKNFFKPANINDQVILFVAGHGVLDANFDYFYASYDMNFSNPSERGIPYESIEGLLDGIKPLKKLLFMDTCHSGEVDKDEVQLADNPTDENKNEDIVFRTVGAALENKENQFGLQNTSELMKSLFTDLRKGTGSTVISSAGGVEYAMESAEWKNGLFTYCLLNGLKTKKADLNNDKEITVKELQTYIQTQVTKLSNGRQTPTSRIENNTLDYRIW